MSQRTEGGKVVGDDRLVISMKMKWCIMRPFSRSVSDTTTERRKGSGNR